MVRKITSLIIVLLSSFNLHAKMKVCTLELVKTLSQHKSSTRLIRTVYKNIGHEVEFVYLPNLRSIYSSNSGQCDAELGRVGDDHIENDYQNLIKVPTPYITYPVNFLFKKNTFSLLKNVYRVKVFHYIHKKNKSILRSLNKEIIKILKLGHIL